MKGRSHWTVGGTGHPSQYIPGTPDVTETVEVTVAFLANLERAAYDFIGDVSYQETKIEFGTMDEFEAKRIVWESENWNVVGEIEYETRTEEITIHGSEGYYLEASGHALEIHGPQSPAFTVGWIDDLAPDSYFAYLADLIGENPYYSGDIYWPGSVGDMGFGETAWTDEIRILYGKDPKIGKPDMGFFANFIHGVSPQVKWGEFWLQAKEPLPDDTPDAKMTFIVRTVAESLSDGTRTEEFGTVTFTIKEKKQISTRAPEVEGLGDHASWLEPRSDGKLLVKPPVVRGAEHSVSLLPVELLVPKDGSTYSGYVSNDLVSTDKLKVAKWERAFYGDPENPELTQSFAEEDIDRFYLKVPMPWKEGEGTATVKIKTDSDPENEIEVVEIPGEPGVFRTNGLILVSNDVDDDVEDKYPEDGTDEGLDDLTHKVKLGDTVTFTIPTPGGQDSTITATVPAVGTLKLKAWHFAGSKTRKLSELNEALEFTEEVLAQIGLKLDADPTPASGDYFYNSNGTFLDLYERTGPSGNIESDFTEEGKQLMRDHNTPGSLNMYFLDDVFLSGAGGFVLTPEHVNGLPDAPPEEKVQYLLDFANKIFVALFQIRSCA